MDGDKFGNSVSIDSDCGLSAVGTPKHNNNEDAVYVFELIYNIRKIMDVPQFDTIKMKKTSLSTRYRLLKPWNWHKWH